MKFGRLRAAAIGGVKTKLLGVVAALACFVGVSQPSASIIDITFTGTAYATRSGYDAQGNFQQLGGTQSFSANFVFDTALGTLSDHRLDGGFVSAFIDFEVFGQWGNGLNGPYSVSMWPGFGTFLTWNDDLSSVHAFTGTAQGGGYFYLRVNDADIDNGAFQFGLCPTFVGGPCGNITNVASTTVIGLPLPTPAPIVGAGLPGIVFAGGGLLAWWRRKRKAATVA